MAIDYFDYYDIPKKFYIDEGALKSKFLIKSKQFHPDFFVNDNQKYDEAMEQTSINNQAFKVLSKYDSRLEYILKSYGLLKESKNEIPQDFLAEMMDINEVIMDLQFDYDQIKMDQVKADTHSISMDLADKVQNLTIKFDELDGDSTNDRMTILDQIKNIYLKQKYVLRLQESLDKFASL
jgi:molecular chaperone HscB